MTKNTMSYDALPIAPRAAWEATKNLDTVAGLPFAAGAATKERMSNPHAWEFATTTGEEFTAERQKTFPRGDGYGEIAVTIRDGYPRDKLVPKGGGITYVATHPTHGRLVFSYPIDAWCRA